jgi:hypothetical protein
MAVEWTILTDEAQLALSREAARRALALVANQAEQLALDIDDGVLSDQGGAEALRLLTALIRLEDHDPVWGVA